MVGAGVLPTRSAVPVRPSAFPPRIPLHPSGVSFSIDKGYAHCARIHNDTQLATLPEEDCVAFEELSNDVERLLINASGG